YSSCFMLTRLSLSSLFPYTTLFRSLSTFFFSLIGDKVPGENSSFQGLYYLLITCGVLVLSTIFLLWKMPQLRRRLFANNLIKKIDRKSTRLNSSHVKISYAVFCLKK